VLSDRGRRCRRVTLDALNLLHPAGPGVEGPSHRGGPGDDLVLVDGCFLQHPEFLGAWELVIFLRSGPPQPAGPYEDPDRAPAATWEARFPDDDPAYAAAVAEVGLHPGQTALDAGCGTGRALPHLRAAVGPTGHVLGLDLTPEMLATARGRGRDADALLALADVHRLPVPAARVDGSFAAGLVPHLPDPGRGLAELARVVRPGGRLVLFHRLLDRTGWWLDRYDDGPDRFLAVAERTSPGLAPLLRLGSGRAVAVGLSLQRSVAEAGSSDRRRSFQVVAGRRRH
jgi:SAM-dependent methyltransferase